MLFCKSDKAPNLIENYRRGFHNVFVNNSCLFSAACKTLEDCNPKGELYSYWKFCEDGICQNCRTDAGLYFQDSLEPPFIVKSLGGHLIIKDKNVQ